MDIKFAKEIEIQGSKFNLDINVEDKDYNEHRKITVVIYEKGRRVYTDFVERNKNADIELVEPVEFILSKFERLFYGEQSQELDEYMYFDRI